MSVQAASTWGIPTDNKSEDDLAKGRSMLTKGEESNLRHAFEMFDHDRSGDLSQGEIIKLLLRMNMAGNKHDAIQTMRRMDVDCDGSVDINEFLNYMDSEDGILKNIPRKEFKSIAGKKLKLGVMGTTWRSHANIAYMTNSGVVIITSTVILGLLMTFRYPSATVAPVL